MSGESSGLACGDSTEPSNNMPVSITQLFCMTLLQYNYPNIRETFAAPIVRWRARWKSCGWCRPLIARTARHPSQRYGDPRNSVSEKPGAQIQTKGCEAKRCT